MIKCYPDIDDDDLEILLENVVHTEDYLSDPECPYREKVKDLLRKATVDEVDIDDLRDLDLAAESSRLFRELKDQKDKLGEQDHSEAMAYFRTSTQLLEKLITYRERAENVKRISEFYSRVLSVMEEILEPDQITEVRNRLKEFA